MLTGQRAHFRSILSLALLIAAPSLAGAAGREPVLAQIQVPHSYYYREMYLPQPTSGPSAVAWSPDGSKICYSSRHGLWIVPSSGGEASQLFSDGELDTEPVWSPDGKSIVFTSDRGGSPQLYRMPAQGGRAQRLTFEGNYNASADISPDGKSLALVHGEGGRYQIAALDLENNLLRILSDGRLDESPSFAPNGSMIIYATETGHRGVLAAVSSDGRFRQRFSLRKGDVREPVWSPFTKRK